jgi:Putative beta barrel porin-7 (BBP7)
MAARWMPAAILALAAWSTAAVGQYHAAGGPVPPATSTSDAPTLPAPPSVTELPPLLAVPAPVGAPQRPCLPCLTEYHPHHVYLPECSPDWGAGSCDGECRPCRRAWVSAAFYFGCMKDLTDINRGFAYGVQIGAGYWFDDTKTTGIEASIFNTHDTYHAVQLDGTLVTSPVTYTSTDVNLRSELWEYEKVRVDGLIGYRYVQLHEKLTVTTPTFLSDVSTRNGVSAFQVGSVADYRVGSYFAEALFKLAFGRNSETVSINGVRTTDGTMCVIPELGVRIGYQLGQGCWGTIGYTFQYMSDVVRPDRGETDFFLHGLVVGFESRF